MRMQGISFFVDYFMFQAHALAQKLDHEASKRRFLIVSVCVHASFSTVANIDRIETPDSQAW